jgi:hypothetical protein
MKGCSVVLVPVLKDIFNLSVPLQREVLCVTVAWNQVAVVSVLKKSPC